MKTYVALIGLSLVLFSCQAKNPDVEAEANLKQAMQTFLYKAVNNDSSNVKYYVEKVVFYPDEKNNDFICDFTVHMQTKMFDTTGIMHATVSHDFKTVKRAY